MRPSTDEVILDRRGTALWIVLSRPAAFNAITPASVRGLEAALAHAESDPTIRSLVITGSGKAFCAGADLKAVQAAGAGENADSATSAFLRAVGSAFHRLERLPIPTLAAVNGIALAGGLELLLCCDLVIASAEARLGDGHANFGQIPGGGGSLRLPRRIGASRAKHLMFTGASIPAAQALHWGLVDEVVDPHALAFRVAELSEQIAAKSSLVLARMKQLVDDAPHLLPAQALEAELRLSDEHMASHDRNEGLAAFAEKRVPVYLGH
ncbi:MAG TPA: enoyl-CoA hydratase/isomerase family protein [Burkholderiaceae bacterium]